MVDNDKCIIFKRELPVLYVQQGGRKKPNKDRLKFIEWLNKNGWEEPNDEHKINNNGL